MIQINIRLLIMLIAQKPIVLGKKLLIGLNESIELIELTFVLFENKPRFSNRFDSALQVCKLPK